MLRLGAAIRPSLPGLVGMEWSVLGDDALEGLKIKALAVL